MKAQFIHEKFIEDSDPINDMGIGYDIELRTIKEADQDYYTLKTLSSKEIKSILLNFEAYSHRDNLIFLGWTKEEVFDIDTIRGKRIMYKNKIFTISNES